MSKLFLPPPLSSLSPSPTSPIIEISHFRGHKRSWHQPGSSPTDMRNLSDTSRTQTTMDLKHASATPKTLIAEVMGATHRQTSSGARDFIGVVQHNFQAPDLSTQAVAISSHSNLLVGTPALLHSDTMGKVPSPSQSSTLKTVLGYASGSGPVYDPGQQQPDQASQPNTMNIPLSHAAEKRPIQRRRMFIARNTSSQKPQGQYKCTQCQVPPYQHIGSLKRHMKLYHMNQPVFRCQICKAGFMYKDHYIGHMNKHFDRPTFQCTHCPEKFIYKGDMYHHRKKKHSSYMLTSTHEMQKETAIRSANIAEACMSQEEKNGIKPLQEDNYP